MFTGVIHHLGTIRDTHIQGDLRLRIACNLRDFTLGESIACNGACLTVVEFGEDWFDVQLSGETLACTALRWNKGDVLHLERAMCLGDALDGHLVTGHIDGVATIINIQPNNESHILTLEAPTPLAKFIAAKGSVTLDGVSLTVNSVEGNFFTVNIIPHTWAVTTFAQRKAKDTLNLEIDLIARYVARLTNS
jgi:riboflavin synthase